MNEINEINEIIEQGFAIFNAFCHSNPAWQSIETNRLFDLLKKHDEERFYEMVGGPFEKVHYNRPGKRRPPKEGDVSYIGCVKYVYKNGDWRKDED